MNRTTWNCTAIGGVFLVAAALLAAPPSGQADLIGFYSFDDANPLTDDSGLGNDLTQVAGSEPTYQLSGGFEAGGYDFNGVQRLIAPINTNPGVLPQLTMGAWVRTNVTTGPSLRHKFIGSDKGGGDRTIGLDYRGAGWAPFGDRYSAFAGTTGPVETPVADFAAPGTFEWSFVAVVYDQSTATATVYADVDRFDTEPLVSATKSPTAFDADTWPTIAIGGLRPDLNAEGWNGTIDNVFFYNEALSAATLTEIRDGGKTRLMQDAYDPNAVIVMPTVLDFENEAAGLDPAIWQLTGTAFSTQPTNSNRHAFNENGDWFVGTYENEKGGGAGTQGDGPTGSAATSPFILQHNTIRALVGGGSHDAEAIATQLRLQVETAPGQWRTVRRDSGHASLVNGTGAPDGEPMREKRWNVGNLVGQKVRYQIVDNNTGGWGHLNVDSIRLLDEARNGNFRTEFDGATLDPDLIVYRPDHIPVAELTGTGKFRFDLGGKNYNSWTTANGNPALKLAADSGETDWVLETHITSITGDASLTHTGLALYFEDRENGHYDMVGFGPYSANGLRAEGPYLDDENPDHDFVAALEGTGVVGDVFLQIERSGDTFDFRYRLPGESSWTTILSESTVLHNRTLLDVAVFNKSFGFRDMASEFEYMAFVPEPGTSILSLLALVGLIGATRRHRNG